MVLASRSPQRRAILEQLGIQYSAAVPEVQELADGSPPDVVAANALRKAQAVGGDLVMGVDTVVALEGRIYGKPHDEDEARAFLQALSARTHEVWSGIALVEAGRVRQGVGVTEVTFCALDEPILEWYLATGEWRDRAGGYAIQGRGAALVERIHGDYSTVVGLPVARLMELAPELLRGS